MTKQRAISHLKDISLWGTINADEYNALKMAVKALEQEPNEPVGNSDKLDCISREALLASLNERGIPYHAGINEAIMELPSVQPKAKTGQWIKRHYTKRNGIQFSMDVCNQCGEEFSYDAETGIGTYDFCPNCGAKMSETLTGSESEG